MKRFILECLITPVNSYQCKLRDVNCNTPKCAKSYEFQNPLAKTTLFVGARNIWFSSPLGLHLPSLTAYLRKTVVC